MVKKQHHHHHQQQVTGGTTTTTTRAPSQRKGRAGTTTNNNVKGSSSGGRTFEVGEDVLVNWNDGNRYAAIVKEVDSSSGSIGFNGCVLYTVEFDNGEIAEDVKAEDVFSPSDGEEDE